MINFKKLILTILFLTTIGHTSTKSANITIDKELAKEAAITALKTVIAGGAAYSTYKWIHKVESNFSKTKAYILATSLILAGCISRKYLIKLYKKNPKLAWTITATIAESFPTYKTILHAYRDFKNQDLELPLGFGRRENNLYVQLYNKKTKTTQWKPVSECRDLISKNPELYPYWLRKRLISNP